jgi:hypothetical protein
MGEVLPIADAGERRKRGADRGRTMSGAKNTKQKRAPRACKQRPPRPQHPPFIWGGIVRRPRHQPGTVAADAERAALEASWKETGRRPSLEEARWWLYYATLPEVLETFNDVLPALIPEITATEQRYCVFELCLSMGMTVDETKDEASRILKGAPFAVGPETMVKSYYDQRKLNRECKHTVDQVTLDEFQGAMAWLVAGARAGQQRNRPRRQ